MRTPDGQAPRAYHDVLEVGGRLSAAPSQRLIDTAFAEDLKNQQQLFESVSHADLAHTLMMSKSGPIPREAAAKLLHALLELHAWPDDFELDPALGDIYTNREAWLNAHCDAAGWLGVSRARREAITCGFHMTTRSQLLTLADGLATLADTLTKTARAHRNTLFPDYTYLQAAQPTTFGHYLLGFAFPIARHVDRALILFDRFNSSPAGGGSANGSIAPQDRAALARLMGFDAPAANTRDAMWQADLPIEAAALIANALITIDRLAEDLMTFATQEFGLVKLSDGHSRASKIMPQKKNPFALSYLRSLANQALGLQTTISASMRTPSGQMDNRLAAYAEIPTSLGQAAQGAHLMADVMAELEVDKTRAKALLAEGKLAASDMAEHVMLATGLDFRQAHKVIGLMIRQLETDGRNLATATAVDLDTAAHQAIGHALDVDDDLIARALDSRQGVAARSCIGGASPQRVDEAIKSLSAEISALRRTIDKRAGAIARAQTKLVGKAQSAAGIA